MKKSHTLSRRGFLAATGAAISAPYFVPSRALGAPNRIGANDRINIAVVGIGGMGSSHLRELRHFQDEAGEVNIVALADVDENRLANAVNMAGPGPTPYRDYRYILERKDVDAVLFATPDHWHAANMVHAAQMGKHVYVEKPACCTIDEGKAMIKAAKENKVSVQVGSQGRSQPEAYLAHRYLANNQIGTVKRVECFHYNSPEDKEPVPNSEPPEELDWDLWLGPLAWRPYNRRLCPGSFRWMMESGGGQIRDRGAHVMSCAMYWMNADGTGPVSVEATGTPPTVGIWDVPPTMDVVYEFKNPDWTMTWNQHDGNAVPAEERTADEPSIERKNYGAVYRGDGGEITVWGGDGGTWAERKIREWEPPAGTVDVYKSPGHKEDWFKGIRTGEKTIMNIEASVGIANLCILGNLSYLLGRKLHWDQAKQEITGDEQAQRMMSRPQRHPYHV